MEGVCTEDLGMGLGTCFSYFLLLSYGLWKIIVGLDGVAAVNLESCYVLVLLWICLHSDAALCHVG